MCKRFIEDLATKIIEKTDLKSLDTKRLREIMEESKTILEKRQEELISELQKSYIVEDYDISGDHRFLAVCSYPECHFYAHYNRNSKGYTFNNGNFETFLTKEELLNHLIIMTRIKDKEQLYNICLKKINIIEELVLYSNIDCRTRLLIIYLLIYIKMMK